MTNARTSTRCPAPTPSTRSSPPRPRPSSSTSTRAPRAATRCGRCARPPARSRSTRRRGPARVAAVVGARRHLARCARCRRVPASPRPPREPPAPVDEVAAARAPRRSRMRSPWLVGAAAALALVAGGAVVRSVQLTDQLDSVRPGRRGHRRAHRAGRHDHHGAASRTGGRAAVVSVELAREVGARHRRPGARTRRADLPDLVPVRLGRGPRPASCPTGERSAVVLAGRPRAAVGVPAAGGSPSRPARRPSAADQTPILAVAVSDRSGAGDAHGHGLHRSVARQRVDARACR